MIGSLISGLFNAAATAYTNETAKEIAEKQNKAQRELAEYQYSKNLEQWHRENAYNSPEAQMQRLADAGLNPNLMYGHGTVGNAGSMPGYQAPDVKGYQVHAPQIDINDPISWYQDMRIKKAQESNLKAQEDNILADTANKQARNILIGNQNISQMIDNAFKRMYNPLRVQSLGYDVAWKVGTLNDRLQMPAYQLENLKERNRVAAMTAQNLAVQIGVNKMRQAYYQGLVQLNSAKRDWQLQMNKYGYGNTLMVQHGKMMNVPVGLIGVEGGKTLQGIYNKIKSWF